MRAKDLKDVLRVAVKFASKKNVRPNLCCVRFDGSENHKCIIYSTDAHELLKWVLESQFSFIPFSLSIPDTRALIKLLQRSKDVHIIHDEDMEDTHVDFMIDNTKHTFEIYNPGTYEPQYPDVEAAIPPMERKDFKFTAEMDRLDLISQLELFIKHRKEQELLQKGLYFKFSDSLDLVSIRNEYCIHEDNRKRIVCMQALHDYSEGHECEFDEDYLLKIIKQVNSDRVYIQSEHSDPCQPYVIHFGDPERKKFVLCPMRLSADDCI